MQIELTLLACCVMLFMHLDCRDTQGLAGPLSDVRLYWCNIKPTDWSQLQDASKCVKTSQDHNVSGVGLKCSPCIGFLFCCACSLDVHCFSIVCCVLL
jgi:hypothetical protein